MLSYNASSDWVAEILAVTPQDGINPPVWVAYTNTLMGPSSANQLYVGGNNTTKIIRSVGGNADPAANTLLLGTGGPNYVKLNDYQLQVISSDTLSTGECTMTPSTNHLPVQAVYSYQCDRQQPVSEHML